MGKNDLEESFHLGLEWKNKCIIRRFFLKRSEGNDGATSKRGSLLLQDGKAAAQNKHEKPSEKTIKSSCASVFSTFTSLPCHAKSMQVKAPIVTSHRLVL